MAFVPHEDDHFPGTFHNFYIVRLKQQLDDFEMPVDQEFEVEGKDAETLVFHHPDGDIVIPRNAVNIIQKKVKPVK